MTLDFTGKVAVVTGGATGIGGATAWRLAECGASVCILDRDAKTGALTAAEITKTVGPCGFVLCNVDDAQQVQAATESVVRQHGHIDVLVNSAGIQLYGDVVSTSEAEWDQLMSINVRGAFLVSKHVVPHVLKQGGAIVNVGSVQSFTAVTNSVAYVTSKHALLGLTRAMALDYAQRGIRVNCVCPGAIDTPMLRWAASLSPDPEAVIRNCDRMHAMGRIGKPEEVANAIAYMASSQASFITGAALVVDGGMLVPAGGMGFQEGGPAAATKK